MERLLQPLTILHPSFSITSKNGCITPHLVLHHIMKNLYIGVVSDTGRLRGTITSDRPVLGYESTHRSFVIMDQVLPPFLLALNTASCIDRGMTLTFMLQIFILQRR